ncbi:MAG: MFS transporter [Ponticaulis sp.]|nr:MFS transporter [Ponticaulis sp.]
MLSFLTRNARWLAGGLLLCFFSGFGQTYFISLSNESIRTALDLSHAEFGLAYSIATLASAFTVAKFGHLADRWSPRRSAAIVIMCLGLAAFLMSFSILSVLILVPALYGLRLFGQGFCGHVAMTSAGKWFERNRGKAVSIVGLGFPLSEMTMPVLAAGVLSLAGFQALWAGGAGVLIFSALPAIFLLLRKDRLPGSADPHENQNVTSEVLNNWRRRDVMKRVEFYLVLVAVLCPPFMNTAFFFHQQHLAEIKSWPISMMVGSMTVFALAQIASSLLTGFLIDRIGSKIILSVYLMPLAIGLTIPAFTESSLVIPLVLGFMGLSNGAAASLLGALWPELFGSKHLGEIRALAYAAMVASTAASPLLTGVLIDVGVRFDLQLACCGAFSLLASALMFLIQPNLRRLNASLLPNELKQKS